MLVLCAVLGMTVFPDRREPSATRTFLPIILLHHAAHFRLHHPQCHGAARALRTAPQPARPQLLKRWSRNNLIMQSLCAAVGLLGFAMQLLGAATPIALTLYAIAIAYLFLLRPIRP